MKDELTTKDELNTLYENTIVNEDKWAENDWETKHDIIKNARQDFKLGKYNSNSTSEYFMKVIYDDEYHRLKELDKLKQSNEHKVTESKDELNTLYENMMNENQDFPYLKITYMGEDTGHVLLIYLPKSGIEAYDDAAPVLGSNQELKEIDKVDEDLLYDFMPGIMYSLTHMGELTKQEAEKLFDENETFLKDYIITSTGGIDSDTMAEIIFNNMEE